MTISGKYGASYARYVVGNTEDSRETNLGMDLDFLLAKGRLGRHFRQGYLKVINANAKNTQYSVQ